MIVSTSFDFQLSESRLPLWKYRLVSLGFLPFVISFPVKGSNSTVIVTLFLCGSRSTFQYCGVRYGLSRYETVSCIPISERAVYSIR